MPFSQQTRPSPIRRLQAPKPAFDFYAACRAQGWERTDSLAAESTVAFRLEAWTAREFREALSQRPK